MNKWMKNVLIFATESYQIMNNAVIKKPTIFSKSFIWFDLIPFYCLDSGIESIKSKLNDLQCPCWQAERGPGCLTTIRVWTGNKNFTSLLTSFQPQLSVNDSKQGQNWSRRVAKSKRWRAGRAHFCTDPLLCNLRSDTEPAEREPFLFPSQD